MKNRSLRSQGWHKSPFDSTYFRFLADGRKEVLFPAVTWRDSFGTLTVTVPELRIVVAA